MATVTQKITKRRYARDIAHELATKWWEAIGRSDAVCDKCGKSIPNGQGYLCQSTRISTNIGGMILNFGDSPDLLCENCFNESRPDPFLGIISGLCDLCGRFSNSGKEFEIIITTRSCEPS